jgi:outer membrane protein OmpA-like peptidoglycan-associated protein
VLNFFLKLLSPFFLLSEKISARTYSVKTVTTICFFTFFFRVHSQPVTEKLGVISEIVMSSECLKKPNYTLFFESVVGAKESERNMYWYRIAFDKDCFIKLTLVPNDEKGRYDLGLYSVKRNGNFCSDREKIEDIEALVTFNDNHQSQEFRESVVYTKVIEVFNDEAIYILINNRSGIDLGHVLEIVTCDDYSYILKVNKAADSSLTSINSVPDDTEIIPQKLCGSISDSVHFGYVNFESKKITVDNLSRQKIDSLEKSQQSISFAVNPEDIKQAEEPISKPASPNSILDAFDMAVIAMNEGSKSISVPIEPATDQQYNSFTKVFNKVTGNKLAAEYRLADEYLDHLQKNQTVTDALPEIKKNNSKSKKVTRVRKINQSREKLIPVNFVAVNAETGIILKQASFKLINETKQRYTKYFYTDSTAVYSTEIDLNENYKIECDLIGYKNYSQHFDTKKRIITDSTSYYIVPLTSLKAGDKFVIPNIYFYANAPVFKEQSFEELNKLAKYMNSNNASILIAGHTNGNKYIAKDKRQTDEELAFSGTAKKLSKKRAEAVRDFLIKSGVQKNRIMIKGYGGKRPIVEEPKNRKEGEKNMRVEIFITKF